DRLSDRGGGLGFGVGRGAIDHGSSVVSEASRTLRILARLSSRWARVVSSIVRSGWARVPAIRSAISFKCSRASERASAGAELPLKEMNPKTSPADEAR